MTKLPQVVRDHDRTVRDNEETHRDRFAHLLKPIRDLAENFNIDLATELEDYLEELEAITISFHDEETNSKRQLNFAEAALLIRGSSLIYSKKVDYLYELVFKVLDTVCAQKDKQIRVDLHNDGDTDDNQDGTTHEAGDRYPGDIVSNFLSLDDVEEDPQQALVGQAAQRGEKEYQPQNLTPPEWEVDRRRAEAMEFAPPLAFLHAVEAQGGAGAGASASFQLSISQIHASGALLINPNADTNYNVLSDHTTALCTAGDTYTSALRDVLKVHTSAENFEPQDQSGFDAGEPHYNDFDHDDDGGAFEGFEDMRRSGGREDAEYAAGYYVGMAGSYMSDRPVSKQLFGAQSKDTAEDVEDEELVDHWTLHNPHDDSNAKRRPFRMGKTYSVPDLSLAHRLPEGPVIASLLVTDTVASSFSSASVASREFGYILKVSKKIKSEISKKRKQMARANRSKTLQGLHNVSAVPHAHEDEALAAASAAAVAYSDVGISVGMNVSVQNHVHADEDGNDGASCANIDFADSYDGGFGGTFDDDYGDAFGPSNDGADVSADGGAFTTFGGKFHNDQYEDAGDEELDVYSSSYAQLCRSHVAAYMRGTHLYAQETNLTRRVSAWEDKLLPVLREQHSRPRFDIHDYGSRLLDTLSVEVAKKMLAQKPKKEGDEDEDDCEQSTGEEDADISKDNSNGEVAVKEAEDSMSEPFISIASKQNATRFEVCRLFLSMLQLANDRNIELSHETANSEGMNNLASLDAVADRLTESLRVKLVSMSKAVDMDEHPGVSHNDASTLESQEDNVYFVTQVTQEQPLGHINSKSDPLTQKNQQSNNKEVVLESIFDEGLNADANADALASKASKSRGGKTVQKRTAMGNLLNQNPPYSLSSSN